MLTLTDLSLLMLAVAVAAWFWTSRGIGESALRLARQHCARSNLELLDKYVAFRKFALIRDARGRRRLGRVYQFEFTADGERRHNGTIVMFGHQAGPVELEPYPFAADGANETFLPDESARTASGETPTDPAPPPSHGGEVVSLDEWRKRKRH